VGFRYSSERFAISLGITGWVSNLPDGRVEIFCEGSAKALEDFLEKIKGVFDRYIIDTDIEWGEATGEFSGFEIRF
jgi:acylphosphatase